MKRTSIQYKALMMCFQRSFKLLIGLLISQLFSTQTILANEYSVDLKITNNHFVNSVIEQYSNKNGSFKVQTGNSNNDTEEKSEPNLNKSLGLRLTVSQKFASIDNHDLMSKLHLSYGNTGLTYPDGVGIFVERIDVNSNAFGLSPEVVLTTWSSDKKINLNVGFGYSFVHSREHFKFGNWNIKEARDFGFLYGMVSIQYQRSPNDNFKFYLDTFLRTSGSDFSFGVKLPIAKS